MKKTPKSEVENLILECESTIAYNSPDHLEPWGTRRDNTRNKVFNRKLSNIWEYKKQLKILDLGCSGGGFVKDCIDDGNFAIGLEGSDYSKKIKRAEWRTIPEFLFTCDITKDFNLFFKSIKKERILFNVITSWDFVEHIAENDLKQVVQNVKKHLANDGIWIISVGCMEDIINGIKLHQTVKSPLWWKTKFKQWGFVELEDYKKYFGNQWVKGKANYKSGFNIVLSLSANNPPKIPKINFMEYMFNKWSGSKLQIFIRRIIIGYL